MITLKTDRLRVDIAEPGAHPNRTSRFDRAGFITSVVLDGQTEFCTMEPTNLVHPTTGGVGLCNEFLFPRACEEAPVGAWFPKFGIGLFRRPDGAPFCFYRQYETKPFAVRWQAEAGRAVFETAPEECLGYAVREHKTISLEENRLTMAVVLENTGSRPLDMREFCHNFITLERQPIGPAYRLEISYLADQGADIKAGTIRGAGRGFTFADYNPRAALVSLGPEQVERREEYGWTLRHLGVPACVETRDSFRPDGLDLWAIDHIISVESFFHIKLAPGASAAWTRSWIFRGARDGV